jgi:hypothetical protein
MTDVTAVHFVRSGGLNLRLFKAFPDETERQYGDTAYCCEVY